MKHYYYKAQWEWFCETGHCYWRAPGGNNLGVVDLRSNTQAGKIGGQAEGFGVFAYESPQVINGAEYLGTDDSVVADLIWEKLTVGADPTGKTAAKPLTGKIDKEVTLYLAGKKLKSEPFTEAHRQRTVDVFQSDYRENVDKYPKSLLQKWVGAKMKEIYGEMSDEKANLLVPPEHRKGILWKKPATTINDSFTDTDGTALESHSAAGFSWSKLAGNSMMVQSNKVQRNATTGHGDRDYRAESDLSTDDMYSKATVGSLGTDFDCAVCVRNSSSARTHYQTEWGNSFRRISKFVAGAHTVLQSDGSSNAVGDILECHANDSTIQAVRNGVAVLTDQTDTSITGNLRAGLSIWHDQSTWDSWEAGDLSFPSFGTQVDTDFGTAVSSMAVNMPATVDSGDLLLAFVVVRNALTWNTIPTGWTKITEQAGGGSVGETSIFYKIADGTEDGGTATWVASTTTTAAWQVVRITNWHGTTPPETGTATSGDSSSANPPSLTPSWGAADTLWVVVAGHTASSAAAFTAAPTNYKSFANNGASSGGSACSIASAFRKLKATSEDPGTFTAGGSNRWWASQTIAIRPASTGSGATASASVASAVFSIIAVAVTAGAAIASGTPSATFSLQALAATGGAIVSPTVLATSFNFQVPGVFGNAQVNPTVLSASFSSLTATASTDTATPSVQSLAFSIQAPIVTGGASRTATELSSTFSIQSPTVSGGATKTTTENAATFAVQSPSVTAAAIVSPTTPNATFSVQNATASTNAATPAVLSAIFSIQAPARTGGATFNPSAQSAVFSIQNPVVSGGAGADGTVIPSVLSATFSVQQPQAPAGPHDLIFLIEKGRFAKRISGITYIIL